LSSYHQTYLETDLRQLVELRNPESFEIFEQLFAQRACSLMNISELARDCGLAADTVRRFIGYFKQLFISWQARPFHVNPGKRMMKMSKYFFYDTGMLRSIIGDFKSHSGQMYENTILTEVKKILSFYGAEKNLYFARTSTGVEADGLLWSCNGKIPFFLEVKQAKNSHPKDIRQLKKYVSETDNSIGLLTYNGSECMRVEENIWAVPAPWLFS
jgi:predicted AAA+ superfamily ATPase